MSSYPYPNPFPQPTAQAAYLTDFPLPPAGAVYDVSEAQDFVTGLSLVRMPYGILAAANIGADDRLIKLPAASGDVAHPAGIVVRTGAIESTRDNLAPGYQAGDPVNLMRQGRIWVTPETAVTKDGAVYARITVSGGSIQLGALRGDTDSGNATLVPGARWKSTTTAYGPGVSALLEFNFIGA